MGSSRRRAREGAMVTVGGSAREERENQKSRLCQGSTAEL
jgi:hypothetical protein